MRGPKTAWADNYGCIRANRVKFGGGFKGANWFNDLRILPQLISS